MNIKKGNAKPVFDFNTSTNPFAYIRDEEDLYNFIEAINSTNDAADKEKIDTRVQRLIWITSSYLLNFCNAVDRNIENLLRLFNIISTPMNSVHSPFEIMIDDCDDQSLKDKFNYFKLNVCGLNSDTSKTIVEKSINVISTIPFENVVEELKKSFNTPRQATLSNGKTKYDVWFMPAENLSVNISKNDNKKVIIVELPRFLIEKEQQKFIEMLFTQKDFCLQKLLEDKTTEMLSLIKKQIRVDNTTAVKEIQEKYLSKAKSYLFDDVYDENGREIQMIEHRKKHTAIHEAGHVVAAYLLNENCEGVSIEPTKTSAGRIQFIQTPENKNKIIIDYAGMMAEKIWLDNKYYEGSYGRYGDAAKATKYAKKLVVEEGKTNKQNQDLAFIDIEELGLSSADTLFITFETIKKCIECWHDSETLISTNFYLVEALSEELLKQKTISGEEATRFLDNIKK